MDNQMVGSLAPAELLTQLSPEQLCLSFIVPAIPVAQPRQKHRARIINGHAITQNYTPTDSPVNSFKATVRMAASKVYGGAPTSDAVHVRFEFILPRPKNMIWKRREMPRVDCAHGKDLDNLEKSVMDALTGILWVNDSQVCWKESRKLIASGSEQPHVSIGVASLSFLSPVPVPEK